MFKTFKKILGIPDKATEAESIKIDTLPASLREFDDSLPIYAPASALDAEKIDGVQDDGSCWVPWRKCPSTGEQWYQRNSYDPNTVEAVEAVDTDDFIEGVACDEGDDFDFDSDNSNQLMRRDVALLFEDKRRELEARGYDGFDDIDTDDGSYDHDD